MCISKYRAVKVSFLRKQTLHAVNHVSFKLYEGETLGVVGESGCGKSTLARAIIGLVKSAGGNILWLGTDLSSQSEKNGTPLAKIFR